MTTGVRFQPQDICPQVGCTRSDSMALPGLLGVRPSRAASKALPLHPAFAEPILSLHEAASNLDSTMAGNTHDSPPIRGEERVGLPDSRKAGEFRGGGRPRPGI